MDVIRRKLEIIDEEMKFLKEMRRRGRLGNLQSLWD